MNKNERIDHNLINKKLNNKVDNIDFSGIVSYMIFSQQIFPKNKDISIFLRETFEISYLDYVMRSRCLIVARITRQIMNLSENELQKAKEQTLKFISTGVVQANKKPSSKRNANDKLEVWLKGL